MVSTMTVSSATCRLEATCALAPTIRTSTGGPEARHELLSQLFETIADAGFLHMALARGLRCPKVGWIGRVGWFGRTSGFEAVSARDSTVTSEGKRYER